MAKAHQNIASQMTTELEEPLTAFAGGMRERRRIVQGGCEKLHKLKMQQTQQVNKVDYISPAYPAASLLPLLPADRLPDQGPIRAGLSQD